MKRHPLLLVLLLLLLALGARIAWKTFFVSEESRIAQQLDGLVTSFEKSGDETLFAARERALRTVKFFAPDFSAEPGPPFDRVENGSEFANVITAFRMRTTRLSITRITRDIRHSKTEADVVTTLRANYNGMGDRGSETRTFQIALKKMGGKWLVTRVDLLETVP